MNFRISWLMLSPQFQALISLEAKDRKIPKLAYFHPEYLEVLY